jgi:hypothetical protein
MGKGGDPQAEKIRDMDVAREKPFTLSHGKDMPTRGAWPEKPVYLLPDLDAEQFRRDVKACVDAVGPPTEEDASHFKSVVFKVQLMQVIRALQLGRI